MFENFTTYIVFFKIKELNGYMPVYDFFGGICLYTIHDGLVYALKDAADG
jgi:hypothetical protein